jgi:RNA polymerase sigma-70 factor (ECF subfamily)
MAQPAMDPEWLIIEQIAAGDRRALEALCERYQRPLFAYLCRVIADDGLAEEVLQDTLLAVWRGAGRVTERSSVRAWLFGIARRQRHNALRRRTLHLVEESALAPLYSSDPEPADLVLTQAAIADLSATIDRLPSDHREIILLTFVDELSYLELADVLGVPIGTVKSRLHSAKRALRSLLEEGGIRPW